VLSHGGFAQALLRIGLEGCAVLYNKYVSFSTPGIESLVFYIHCDSFN